MGLKGNDAEIWATDKPDTTTMTDEAMDPIGSGTPVLQWQVTDHAKDVWDPSVTFTVEVSTDGGSSWSTASTSNYTLRYNVGVVEFDSDPFGGSTSGNDVRVDGNYLPKHAIAEGFETDLTIEPNLLDQSGFGDESPNRKKGLFGLSGSFGTYRILGQNIDSGGDNDGPKLREILFDAPTNSSGNATAPDFVFRFEPNNAHSTMLGAWVQLSEESIEAPSSDSQARSFSMEVDDQTAAMSSQTANAIDIISP